MPTSATLRVASGVGPRWFKLDQAKFQELGAESQHILADPVDGLAVFACQLAARGVDRRSAREPLEDPPAGLVHTVVATGLDVEKHGLGDEAPMDDGSRDRRASCFEVRRVQGNRI